MSGDGLWLVRAGEAHQIRACDLVTESGAARMLGVSRQRVDQLRASDFPDPIITTTHARLWLREDVEAFQAMRIDAKRLRPDHPALDPQQGDERADPQERA